MVMNALGFILFETAIGSCGLVWGETGLLATTLPESDLARTRARIMRRYPTTAPLDPPADVQWAKENIVALLTGGRADFTRVELDMEALSPFDRHVYNYARTIPVGATRTYGEVARAIGDSGAARAVGKSLGNNPWPIIIPCHRVVAAGGTSGGFSAPGGISTNARLLSIENARFGDEPTLFKHLPVAFQSR